MKKLLMYLTVACFLCLMAGQYQMNVSAEKLDTQEANVKLTEAQKKELEGLYNDMFETKKKLIGKYAEYGVITPEKAEKKLAHLEEFKSKIAENGYVLNWHHHGKKCKDHDKE